MLYFHPILKNVRKIFRKNSEFGVQTSNYTFKKSDREQLDQKVGLSKPTILHDSHA